MALTKRGARAGASLYSIPVSLADQSPALAASVDKSVGKAMPYHWRMKTSYIFGAILACSLAGTLVGARATKTALLVVTGLLSAYGLFRLLA